MSVTTQDLISGGYKTWEGGDAFEDLVGPFYFKKLDDGSYHSAFVSEGRHKNGGGMLHGGLLMTFADFSLCMAATNHYKEESCSTISFSSEFVSAASIGALIRCMPKVIRKTGSLVFVSGELESDGDVVMVMCGDVVVVSRWLTFVVMSCGSCRW